MPALGGVSPFFLWELLSAAGYPNPPLYEGYDFVETGVRRCSVTMNILQHPLNPGWPAIVTQVIGHRLIDSWEVAAIKALTTFCEQHPLEVVLTPFGIFLAVNENDPLWQNMIDHSDILQALMLRAPSVLQLGA